MITFGQRLKILRAKAEMSQSDLAAKIGVSVQSISKWECEKSMPDILQIVPLATVLGVTTDYLLGMDYDEKALFDELYQKVDRVLAYADGDFNSYHAFSVLKAYELQKEFQAKFPMNYEIKLRCATLLCSYLDHARKGHINLTFDKYNEFLREGENMVRTLLRQDNDPTRLIKARWILCEFLNMGKKFEEAENVAEKLPDVNGIRLDALVRVYSENNVNEDALSTAEDLARTYGKLYLSGLWWRARRTSARYGNARRLLAIERWKDLKRAAEEYDRMFGTEYPALVETKLKVIETLCRLCGEYASIDDIDSALSCLKESTAIAMTIYSEAKLHETDPAQFNDLLGMLKALPKLHYNFIIFTDENAITQSKIYKECQRQLDELE